ncbi:MAG: biotin/lipoyl-binding protein, partial [Ruminococcus sp.]|nr:biotin/lipoyl-binding protein [Ruminococcus sp.]
MNEKIDIKNTEKEERSPIRKREIIKTLLIIFLAGMLILTFFSNTIMNRHLPEISTEAVNSGKLTERVRGSGIVESNQTYEVKAEKAMTIVAINIKKGQEIKKDDVLFTLTAESDATLKEAEKALQETELEYEKALLDT